MKRFLIIFILFSSISLFSQDSSEEKEKKHSIGFFASPIAYTAWSTGYKIIADQQSSGYRRTFTYFNPSGIAYQYNIHRAYRLQIGLFATFENNVFYRLQVETNLYKNVTYKVNYLNIPFNVKCFPTHFSNKETYGGFFIQIGANFDFITKEKIESILYYSYTPSSGGGAYTNLTEQSNSTDVKFNRICPTIAIGQEIVGDRFSFFYGGNLQLPAFYQAHNTLEYFKNTKFSLINIGLNYRF